MYLRFPVNPACLNSISTSKQKKQRVGNIIRLLKWYQNRRLRVIKVLIKKFNLTVPGSPVRSPAGSGLTLPRYPFLPRPQLEQTPGTLDNRGLYITAVAMALWTPYADEALDLTKNKQPPERDQSFRPTVPDVRYARVSPDLEENSYHNYAYEYTVPSSQISSNESLFYRKVPSPPHSLDSLDVDSLSDDVEYQAFERDALRAMAEKNGGSLLGNNPKMRRAVQTNQAADDCYRKQRERNNYAAKQSRDRRKLREVRLAFQVTFLKKKIAALRTRIDERVCVRCQQQCRC